MCFENVHRRKPDMYTEYELSICSPVCMTLLPAPHHQVQGESTVMGTIPEAISSGSSGHTRTQGRPSTSHRRIPGRFFCNLLHA